MEIEEAVAALVGFIVGWISCKARYRRLFIWAQKQQWLNESPEWMSEDGDVHAVGATLEALKVLKRYGLLDVE